MEKSLNSWVRHKKTDDNTDLDESETENDKLLSYTQTLQMDILILQKDQVVSQTRLNNIIHWSIILFWILKVLFIF